MDIQRVNVNKVMPGMLVAENVYNSINQLIVPRDARLTEKAITRLHFHSINSIRIFIESEEELAANTVPSPIPNSRELSYFDKLQDTEEFNEFHEEFSDTIESFESKFSRLVKDDADPEAAALVNGIKKLLSSCRTGIQVFDLLHCMRGYDDITFAHSINVALICAVMGTWMGFDKKELDVLIQCGIYHDVGKLSIPKHIIDKPGKLTDEEYNLVKTHTMRGYNILRNKKLDKRVKMAAMMHHERCDGSGYPLGIKSDQIDDFSKIVAIADVYDAMTSARVYRHGLCPFITIREFEQNGLSLYDPKYLMTFLEHISQSYLGNQVRLSDGRIGTIIYINKLSYAKPMIQVGEQYIDLTRESSLFIDAIL